MAATDITVVEATLKEGWTEDQLEVQFLKGDKLMEQLGVRNPDQLLGDKALTAIWTGRAGGFSMIPDTGSSSTNKADGQKTAQAEWKMKRAFNAIEIDTAAIKRTGNDSLAVARVVDTEVEGTVSDTQKQIVRQLAAGDGTGFICAIVKQGAKGKTVKLATTGTYGFGVEATRQQWLAEGQILDIGTSEEEAKVVADATITAFSDDETEPTITLDKEVEKESEGDISIANSRSGKTSYSMNGFRNLASQTSTLGGIEPTVTPGWKAAFVDSTGGAITRQRVIKGRRKVRQRGVQPDWAWTSLKQVEALENETFPQVRFDGVDNQNTGDGESIKIGNLVIQAHEDCPDGDFTFVNKANVFMIRDEKPYWLTQRYGNGILMPQANSTFLYGSLEWYVELATNRRNAIGQFTGLS